jgi:GNAT superfamily N-acetyltransferase
MVSAAATAGEALRPVEVHPATADRFADVAAVLGPKKAGVPVCWCLTYRIPNAEDHVLRGEDRPARLRRFCEQEPPPGLIGYVDGQPAGWVSVGPRDGLPRLRRSRTIPRVDDTAVWSVVCFVVRSAFRGRGVTRALLAGAVDHARRHDAPAVEGYPVDPGEGRISATLAHVGTTSLFESAGFQRVARTASTSGGAPRWLVRLPL